VPRFHATPTRGDTLFKSRWRSPGDERLNDRIQFVHAALVVDVGVDLVTQPEIHLQSI
jgi:hypothetical protein